MSSGASGQAVYRVKQANGSTDHSNHSCILSLKIFQAKNKLHLLFFLMKAIRIEMNEDYAADNAFYVNYSGTV